MTPAWLSTRFLAARRAGARRGHGGVALIRVPRTLPRVLDPAQVDALVGAVRTERDRAMVLGGLRRCEVLGLRLGDLKVGERGLFIAEVNGGRQRIVPVSARVLRHRRPLPGPGTPANLGDRPCLRRPQGSTPWPAAFRRRRG